MPSPRSEFLAGVRAELPILVGVIPFGMIYGVLALDAGLSAVQTQAMSAVVFAGSAQVVMALLFGSHTPALVIVLTAFMVNLRHALYSASIAPYLRHLRPLWRWTLAYLLTDEAYAVSIGHYRQEGDQRHKQWFLLGSGLALWSSWQLSTAAGVFLGAQLPESWSLDFTLALTFIALVVPTLNDRASVAAAAAAGLASVLAFRLPLNLGLLTAALVGIGVGVIAENRVEAQAWRRRMQDDA